MTNSGKRVVIRLYSPEAIDLIEGLPRGFRSLVLESALMSYRKTDIGQALINHLQYRKKDGGNGKKAPVRGNDSLFSQLKGDF